MRREFSVRRAPHGRGYQIMEDYVHLYMDGLSENKAHNIVAALRKREGTGGTK